MGTKIGEKIQKATDDGRVTSAEANAIAKAARAQGIVEYPLNKIVI